ncbi:MAG: diaminopimelate epimerase [Firmicutes bacterium]|nr:diaminopimelate epimerase [Bacillota bacterium]
MRFTKLHGLGNDFIVVNAIEEMDIPENLSEFAVMICDRHFGVGADGLVLVRHGEGVDITMQIFNSDGSEADTCGNAIRCVAKYAYENELVKKPLMKVETLAGIVVPELIIENGDVKGVKVCMGEPLLSREKIPMIGPVGRVINEPLQVEGETVHITSVSMGNPHSVLFVPDVNAVVLENLGPRIGKHELFYRKTNVEVVQVINEKEIRMRVWERGAGLTLACGTGACAAAVAAILNGYTGRNVLVHLSAGTLNIEWTEENKVFMTGPAEKVFTGDYKTT